MFTFYMLEARSFRVYNKIIVYLKSFLQEKSIKYEHKAEIILFETYVVLPLIPSYTE